jgi:hypothetical protein
MKHYKLVNKKVVEEPDVAKWAAWFEGTERIVQQNTIRPYFISTVFLGLDHGYLADADPILFETMIFSDDADDRFEGYQVRYCTYEEAQQGHLDALHLVRSETNVLP